MLQQTRVEAGKGYFLRWMEELPHVEALANVTDEKLMKLWQGLGYYNRARNLKKAAGIIMEQYGGVLPHSYEELLALPGIGSYTAGAIGSIAFGLPVVAVDGNVLRVVARLTADKDDIGSPATKKKVEKLLGNIIPEERPGDFNQALMELGAMICIPNGGPKCDQCPLSDSCEAHSSGIEADLPVKAPKKARKVEKRTILILRNNDRILLHKREDKGLLAGLWELPGLDGEPGPEEIKSIIERKGLFVKDIQALPEAKHIFSHIEWHMTGFIAEVEMSGPEEKPRWVWADRQDLKTRYALPSAFRYYMEFLTDEVYRSRKDHRW